MSEYENDSANNTPTESNTGELHQAERAAEETTSEQQLLAGKYKDVNALEAGYKEQQRVNNDLRRAHDEQTKVPDDYSLPEGVSVDENSFNEVKSFAKANNVSQSAFNILVKGLSETTKKAQEIESEKRNALKSSIGDRADEKLNNVEAYISSHYPEKVAKKLINTIDDVETFNYFSQKRESDISGIPMGDASFSNGNQVVTIDDVRQAQRDYELHPSSAAKKNRHIELLTKLAEQKQRKK